MSQFAMFGAHRLSKMGFVAAYLAAVSTTGALQSRDAGRERLLWPPKAQGAGKRVQCQAQSDGDSPASALSKELNSSSSYQRLTTPARLERNTHALAGLLDSRKIAIYEIYKRLACDTEPSEIVTALVHFGDSLDGHPGVVHGGILALVLDDVFGFAFGAMGVPMAVTANLSLDYRAPTPADTTVLIKVYLDQREDRKLFFRGQLTSLDGSLVYTESSCLYIIPRTVWEEISRQTT